MAFIENKKFRVNKIIYFNPENKWGVLGTINMEPLNGLETSLLNKYSNITISGNFEGVFEGCEIEVSGEIVENSRYGKQIQIRSLKVVQDLKSKESVINFLSRSIIKGISIQNAKKIYESFKEKAIEIVLRNPDKLISIHGIGEKTISKIKESVTYYKSMEELVNFGTEIGLSYSVISRLNKELGDSAVAIIKEDPFKILDISPNLSFSLVDEIYLKCGHDPLGQKRLDTGLLYTLKQVATLEGSTGCKLNILMKKYYYLLKLNEDDIFFKNLLLSLEERNKVIIDKERSIVFYQPYIEIEKSIADKVVTLNTYGILGNKINEDIIEEEIHNFPFTLNSQQVRAIRDALKSNVYVLSGLPGSGKSSITKALYRIYTRCGHSVVLLSPTAKACRRLEECTGGKALTIHKYIGMKSDGTVVEGHEGDNTVLIVDEASMMDIILFDYLLRRMNLTSRILLVGDNNQLPSVQAGNVLGDLIDSKKVKFSILTDVMRQKEDSSIISYCNDINKGIIFDPIIKSDFHYEEFGTAEELQDFFVEEYLQNVEKYGLSEVQVITPYKKGELGMNTLNTLLQGYYNAKGEEVMEPFRIGDRVRHTQNNYDKNVYNGEVGIITNVTEDGDILVDYGNKRIPYDSTDIDELTLSYCSTVHASQGSEYKVCFVILDDTSVNDFLLIRRLLYTAVSRGKEKVYILTKPYLVDHCIENNSYKPRITKLKEFLETITI